MAASIVEAVARIKRAGDPLGMLGRGAVERVCEELGHEWRERELDPATTVALFVRQVLHGNCPCSEVRHLPVAGAGATFTPSAYCQARSRLPLAAYQALLTRGVDAALPLSRRPGHLWLGRHRTFHVDGSTFSMPDTPELRKAFGVPAAQKKGCVFPVAHLLVLFSAATGLLVDAAASPLYTGDLAGAPDLHPHLDEGDVLIGDDSFGSYAHLALLSGQNLHGLFPVHHKRLVDFTAGRAHTREGKKAVAGMPRSRWVRSLGKDDQVVEWFKPKGRPAWMSKGRYATLPASITVRELRRTVRRPGLGEVTLTMATTLLDPHAYPAAALLDLRLRRWDVETNHRPPEDDHEDGRVALQDRGGRAQGVGRVLPGLQPGAGGDAGGGAAAGGAGEPDQLRRRAGVGAARAAGVGDAGPDRQPAPPEPRRAPLQEAAGEAIRPDEQAKRPTAAEAQKTAEKGLTTCH